METVVSRGTRHLDLGCGNSLRNPYARDNLYGVDIQQALSTSGIEIRRANVAVEPIPFPDNYFDSVSAYDFLEHVPRILAKDNGTRFPFIELMNEIWRVMIPGGRFYALTPVFPHAAAFKDPTHVNILTRHSHAYFTRPELLARMYGFTGDFTVIRVLPARSREFEYEPTAAPSIMRRLRLLVRKLRSKNSHMVWEFEANKTVPS
jgi:SAM-dependent methyltransferase